MVQVYQTKMSCHNDVTPLIIYGFVLDRHQCLAGSLYSLILFLYQ